MSAGRAGAAMYLAAAVVFVLSGALSLLGESGLAASAFLILGAAFLVLALSSWPRRDETKATESSSR